MELSMAQLRELICTTPTAVQHAHQARPRYVLVRGTNSGVFCGVLVSEEGQTVELTECRHIWYWAGAANVADMALTGVARPSECKFVAPVTRLRVLDAIEVVDTTLVAESSLRAVPIWTKK